MMNKKLLALALALVMVVGLLAGCGGSKNKDLVGDWTANLDLTDEFKAYFDAELAAEMGDMGDIIDPAELFDLSELNAVMVWKMSMKEDGAITMTLDAQEFAGSMETVMETMKNNLIDAIPSIMEASFAQDGMTLEQAEQALGMMGMSLDDLMDEMAQELENSFDTEVRAQLADLDLNAEESGYYTVDGNKLYVVDNKGDKPNPDSYLEFELKGDELVVTDMPDELKEAFAEIQEIGDSILPITFKRG